MPERLNIWNKFNICHITRFLCHKYQIIFYNKIYLNQKPKLEQEFWSSPNIDLLLLKFAKGINGSFPSSIRF